MAFLKRVILAATTGYILCFYSEFYFFNEGPGHTAAASIASNPLELLGFLLEMCLYYGCWAFLFLATISYFRARSLWALFLAGAVFGWLTEGTVVPVIYESPPGTVFWPSLGWHAMVDVLLGWYGMRLLLRRNRPWLTLAATIPLGLFWGVWSTWFWKADFPEARPPLDPAGFAAFSFTFGLLCVAAYAVQERWGGACFRPTRWEVGLVSAWTLFCFGVIVVPVYQFQAILLPVLLGGTCIALARNRRVEQREDVIAALKGRVDGINYAILCLISPLAALSYALMYEFEIRWPLAETICPPLTHVATAMYVFSFFYLLIKRPPGSGAPSQTPALGSGNASG